MNHTIDLDRKADFIANAARAAYLRGEIDRAMMEEIISDAYSL